MSDYTDSEEHEHEGPCVVEYQPNWSFQSLDILAHVINGIGGALNAFANTFAFTARELAAAANYRRSLQQYAIQQHEEDRRRRSIVDDIEALERGEKP